MGTYGWASIQASQLKQAVLRIVFDLNVFFSGVSSFSLSGRLRAVGLDALARLSTVIYFI